jgi:hypothetical protein
VNGEEEYTDDQLRDARAQTEKETGQTVSDREMIARFGRSVSRDPGGDATDTSSRTIRADELDPVDTSRSGRHAAPGLLGKVFRRRS